MNLHEALVSLIDFARERDADSDPRMGKAIRIVGKKADRLRERHEARSEVLSIDLTAPLGMGRSQIVVDFSSHFCRCGNRKQTHTAVCTVCYYRLAPRFRKALQRGFGVGFEQAYELALSDLGHLPEQLTPALDYSKPQ